MVSYLPKMCMLCDDAPCSEQCKVEGAIYQRDDGTFSLRLEKDCKSLNFDGISVAEDVNLGISRSVKYNINWSLC
jgi:hypothetical protein